MLSACFSIPRTALPAFTAGLPALVPGQLPASVPDGCPAPATVTSTAQHLDGPVYRTVAVSDPGTDRVTVHVRAFTT